MPNFLRLISTSLLGIFILSSCSDAKKDNDISSSNQSDYSKLEEYQTCDMDTDSFNDILIKNIKNELTCIKNNLKIFVEVVKSDFPGNLSKKELKLYIKLSMPEVEENIYEVIDQIFIINNLLHDDPQDYISAKYISSLMDTLIDINQEISKHDIASFFNYSLSENEGLTADEYLERRAIVSATFRYVGSRISQEIGINANRISLKELLEKFKPLTDSDVFQRIEQFLFLKKMLIGGEKESLSNIDIRRLSTMLSDIATLAFDISQFNNLKPGVAEQRFVLKLAYEDLKIINNNLFYKNSDEVVISFDDVYNMLNIFVDEDSPWSLLRRLNIYEPNVLDLKEILLGKSLYKREMTGREIEKLISEFILSQVEKGLFIYRTFDISENQVILASGKPMSRAVTLFAPEDAGQADLINEFNRIVQTTRYYKGELFSAEYGAGYNRTALGVFEVSLWEHLVEMIFSKLGSRSNSVARGYYMTTNQIAKNLLQRFENILVGEGYIFPDRSTSMAETFSLISSLFQNTSNGDSRIEINELRDLIISANSAYNMSVTTHDYMSKFCKPLPLGLSEAQVNAKLADKTKCYSDKYGRYHPMWYRFKLLDIFKVKNSGKTIAGSLPGLTKAFGNNARQLDVYFNDVEKFARTCAFYNDKKTVVPVRQGDYFMIYTGAIAIEQLINRYDTNNNNFMDKNETDQAYEDLFKPAIEALLPKKDLIEGLLWGLGGVLPVVGDYIRDFNKNLGKIVFDYLIRHGNVPNMETKGELFYIYEFFLETRGNGNTHSGASRSRVAQLLAYIASVSPGVNSPTSFHCDMLKNPDSHSFAQ